MRRSFFLFIIPVRDSPCDLKCNVDCSAKQRKQHYDLFKRHGASPFPPLGVRGRPRFQEKFAPPGTQVPVRSSAACICGTQRLVAALRLRLKHTIIMGQLQLRLCQCDSKKRGLVLDKPRGIVYTENTEGAGPYKRLAPYHCVKKKNDCSGLGNFEAVIFSFYHHCARQSM